MHTMEFTLRQQLLRDANCYLQRGWSVIPVNGKRPPRAFRWKQWQDARPTPDQVRDWINIHWPCGLAIITGSISGLVVVDADTQAAADLWASSYAWPASTLQVQTPHGWHFYHAIPEGQIVRSRLRFRPAVDLSAEGGYVVAPPSPGYRWAKGSDWSADLTPLAMDAIE